MEGGCVCVCGGGGLHDMVVVHVGCKGPKWVRGVGASLIYYIREARLMGRCKQPKFKTCTEP